MVLNPTCSKDIRQSQQQRIKTIISPSYETVSRFLWRKVAEFEVDFRFVQGRYIVLLVWGAAGHDFEANPTTRRFSPTLFSRHISLSSVPKRWVEVTHILRAGKRGFQSDCDSSGASPRSKVQPYPSLSIFLSHCIPYLL